MTKTNLNVKYIFTCNHILHLHQIYLLYFPRINHRSLLNRIYGSVPSKIFEYARLGLPILYFGGGEGEKIIEQYHLGWVAESGNYTDLKLIASKINPSEIKINYREKIKETAIEHFDFKAQLISLIEKL